MCTHICIINIATIDEIRGHDLGKQGRLFRRVWKEEG